LVPSGPVPVVVGLVTTNRAYTRHNAEPAQQFNWGLALFSRQVATPDGHWLAALREAAESDGA
jgi:hypothetical protein